jgi:hypothetical protein
VFTSDLLDTISKMTPGSVAKAAPALVVQTCNDGVYRVVAKSLGR